MHGGAAGEHVEAGDTQSCPRLSNRLPIRLPDGCPAMQTADLRLDSPLYTPCCEAADVFSVVCHCGGVETPSISCRRLVAA